MRRTILAILAATAMIAGPVHAALAEPTQGDAPADPGSIGIRLVDAPADAGDDPRAQLHIVDHLAPGTVITRRIEVSSTVGRQVEVAVYPAAATIADGDFVGADGHTENDLSSWTSVAPGAVDVSAGGRVTVSVTIRVPPDAAPGEQYGVVWAEARSAPAEPGGIVQVSRVGVRLYVSIGPGGPPAADFAIDSLTASRSRDGSPMVFAAVRNTGGRALDLSGTLELSDGPGGIRAGPFPAVLGTTLGIGETEPVSIRLAGELPAGPWDATVTLHSGRIGHAAQATITFPATGAAPAVETTSPGEGSGPPTLIAGLAVAGAALLLGTGLVALRRRRQ